MYNSANDISLKDWLDIVDMQKKKMGWSDTMTIQKVLGRLQSLHELHAWFNSMGDILGWDDWKNKLLMAFPKPDDYCLELRRAMNRKRRPNETYVDYFKDKVALLEKLGITGEKAVSCVISSLTSHDLLVCGMARMGNYQSPEEMLDYFKKCDEKEAVALKRDQSTSSQSPEKKLDANTSQENGGVSKRKMKKKCQKCLQMGHVATECTVTPLLPFPQRPLGKPNRLSQQNRMRRLNQTAPGRMQNTKGQTQPPHRFPVKMAPGGKKKKKVPIPTCNYCGRQGHKTSTCPHPKLEELKRMQSGAGLKTACAHCGDAGHVSFNCTRPRPSNDRAPAQADAKKNIQCGFCLKMGHSVDMCHVGNRQAQRNAKRDGSYQKAANEGPCSFCGSTRHASRHCGRAPQLAPDPQVSAVGHQGAREHDQKPRPADRDFGGAQRRQDDRQAGFGYNKQAVEPQGGYRTMLCLKCYKLGHRTELCPRAIGYRR